MGITPSSPVPKRAHSRKRKHRGYSDNDAAMSHVLHRQGQPHRRRRATSTHGQAFEPNRAPMSPYNYNPDMGYRYSQGPHYTPVIPLESRKLVPSIQRRYLEPVIPVLQSQTLNPTPHTPVIPSILGHVTEPGPHVQTPGHLAGMPLQQPNTPVQDVGLQTQTAPLKQRSTRRRRKRNSLVSEVTMGDGEHTSSTQRRIRSHVSRRPSQTTPLSDMRTQSPQDQHQYPLLRASSVANTSKRPVINDYEDETENFAKGNEEESLDVASGPSRRINRVQTPYYRPRSLQLSNENSPASSHSAELSVQLSEMPSQFSNTHPLPSSVNQGSIRDRARSISSYTTTTDMYASRTVPPTTPTNAQTIHTAPSRLSYQENQLERNPLPPPPVDIFELPEWQHLRYLLEIPPKRDNIGQVNIAIGETSPIHSVSTGSPTQKQKKGLFRVFSLKKSAPSAPSPARKESTRSPGPPHRSTAETAVALLSRLAPYVVVNTTPQQRSMGPMSRDTSQAHVVNRNSLNVPAPHPQTAYRIPVPSIPVITSQFPGTPPTVPTNTPPYSNSTGLSDHYPHIPPAQVQTQPEPEAQPQRIIFDVNSGKPFFLMHSPWPVVYEDEEYPSTAHLLEALKFLPKYPEIAQRIRLTKEHRDVQKISAENAALVDPAFTATVVENVHKVVSLKFQQHADLRHYLCNLDDGTQIIYNDPLDSFWGIGFDGKGMNELGKVLQRVMKELKPKRPPRRAT